MSARWTNEEVTILKENYRKMNILKIINMKLLNRSFNSIALKANRLNLSSNYLAENNPMWKGKDVGYGKLHDWVRRHKKTSLYCEKCGIVYDKLDLANISQEYRRDINDYLWLCRKCHMREDGRIEKLKILGKQIRESGIISRNKITGRYFKNG